jgi:hypothetical protein
MVASTASPGPGDDGSLNLTTKDRFFARTLQKPDRAIERMVRIHSPPPVFLLDCSFLI